MAVGVRPEVALARQAGLSVGELVGIVVNQHMQTSDPDIYAVGDAVEVQDFVGAFDALIPLACTGLNEKVLKKRGMAYEKVYVHPASHAGYYPGAAQMSLKLLFDPKKGKILGAQPVGTDGVDKRIDVLAVAIRAGMTVFDLEDLELCYAPPYGSAKDPVNYVGFVAANVLNGDAVLCHVSDIVDRKNGQVLLDVRSPGEVQAGTIPDSVNIPADELRSHLGDMDRDREYLVFCQVGLRGYLACRVLTQHGFSARNLTGGYKTYCAVTGLGLKR
jgi:rhodanese-related sulfurtransferase